MEIKKLCKYTHDAYIISENLRDTELMPYMDMVIDDINERLNSNFPVFSDWITFVTSYNEVFKEEENFKALSVDAYTAFPDRYLRTVVALGAAFNFFTNDEEGEQIAGKYYVQYERNISMMVRDYHELVPDLFKNETGGYITNSYNGEENVESAIEGIVMNHGDIW